MENPKDFYIASFDVGKKNFAQYAEKCELEDIENLHKNHKNISNKDLIEKVYLSGERVQIGVYDLRDDSSSNLLDLQTRKNIISHLESFSWLWEKCNIIIIEQQYFNTWNPKGRKKAGSQANVDAIKIAEGLFMWFLSNYPLKIVEYFGSQNKTQILGAEKGLNKNKRKEWAKNKCREVFTLRGDEEMEELFKLQDRIFNKRLNTEEKIIGYIDSYPLNLTEDLNLLVNSVVRNRQKLDDIGDAFLQAQAYKLKKLICST